VNKKKFECGFKISIGDETLRKAMEFKANGKYGSPEALSFAIT
jgi:hypothetical protein